MHDIFSSTKKLALGTVQFGLPYGIANQSGQVSLENVKAILDLARFSGIDTLDTAIAYGESEACLGKVGTTGFKTVTKLPSIPEGVTDVRRWVYDQMQSSLYRLGGQSVYGLLLHHSQQLVGPKGKDLVQALEHLKTEGVVEKIGVSIYSPTELDNATRACPVDLVQAPFNLLDQRLNATGWLQKLHDSGVEVHVRSVFLQGLLLMSRAAIPAKFKPWSYLWGAWHDWLATHHVSAAQACIGFVHEFPQIDRVVVGVESVQQLGQIIDAAREPYISVLPDLSCTDEMLINPSKWNLL